jgi:hypothetical protein
MSLGDEITKIVNLFVKSNLDFYSVVFSLLIAAVMGFLISLLYRKTHRGLNYEHTFMATLVLMAPIVSIVMLYIRGDLVLSLGLIGSLSIVRFRTPIKDTRDMVFLFWVIAVGLGAGTYNWAVVVISTIFITILVALLYFIRYGNSKNMDFVLVVSGKNPLHSESIQKIVNQYAGEARIRSIEQEKDIWEMVYELRLAKVGADPAEKLVQELQGKKGIVRVSLLAPQLALPL